MTCTGKMKVCVNGETHKPGFGPVCAQSPERHVFDRACADSEFWPISIPVSEPFVLMDKYCSPPKNWLQYKQAHVEDKYLQWIQLLSCVGIITYGFIFVIHIPVLYYYFKHMIGLGTVICNSLNLLSVNMNISCSVITLLLMTFSEDFVPVLHLSRISNFAPWFRSVINMNDLSCGYLYLFQ